MKSKLFYLFALLFVITINAQAPQKFSYQAVLRNSSGNLIANTNVGVKISIYQNSASGTPVYSESHASTTNANGLMSLQVGEGTVIINGNFSTIDWASGTYYIKSEIDPTGGNNYTISQTSQLLSVPFALSALTSKDSYWKKNNSDIYFNTGNVGIGTNNTNNYPLNIQNSGSNGIRVQPNSSNGTAISVGGIGRVEVDSPGVSGGRLMIKENGYVGIGNNSPNSPLSFAPVLGKKITLYPGSTGDVGLGVSGNRLQIYSDNPNADVAIGYDASGTFNERFAVKPNGALAVNGNTGSIGSVLVSNGDGNSANWIPINQVLPIIYRTGRSNFINTNNTTANFPSDTNMVISVTQSTRIIFQVHTSVYSSCSVGPCYPVWDFEILKDNAQVKLASLTTHSTSSRYSDARSLGPFVVDVTPGTYTFSFRGFVAQVGSIGGSTDMTISVTAMLYPL